MAWGSGDLGAVKLYRHTFGQPYSGKRARGDKCNGPRDLFTLLLMENKLLMVGRGVRGRTLAEAEAHKAFVDEFEQADEHGQGVLF